MYSAKDVCLLFIFVMNCWWLSPFLLYSEIILTDLIWLFEINEKDQHIRKPYKLWMEPLRLLSLAWGCFQLKFTVNDIFAISPCVTTIHIYTNNPSIYFWPRCKFHNSETNFSFLITTGWFNKNLTLLKIDFDQLMFSISLILLHFSGNEVIGHKWWENQHNWLNRE